MSRSNLVTATITIHLTRMVYSNTTLGALEELRREIVCDFGELTENVTNVAVGYIDHSGEASEGRVETFDNLAQGIRVCAAREREQQMEARANEYMRRWIQEGQTDAQAMTDLPEVR